MNARIRLAITRATLLPTVLVLSSGCALQQYLLTAKNDSREYKQVEIVYDVQSGRSSPPSRALQQVALLDESESPAKLNGSWSAARLSIDFPHPDNIPEMARATLILSHYDSTITPPVESLGERISRRLRQVTERHGETLQKPSSMAATPSGPDDEIWVLDFPKQQLDLLLTDLSKSGFFENQIRPAGGTHLLVTLDHGKTTKTWTPEPRLDDFITRVFREGMLEGFVSKESPPVTISDK